jgi:hypothetical protein
LRATMPDFQHRRRDAGMGNGAAILNLKSEPRCWVEHHLHQGI